MTASLRPVNARVPGNYPLKGGKNFERMWDMATKPDIERLAVEERRRVTTRECPFCGHDAWEVGGDIAVVYYLGNLITIGQPGEGFGVLPLACKECGFVRFHTQKPLIDRLRPTNASSRSK
jgi:hypothetical protein